MKTEFVRINYDNKATSTSETEQHQKVIKEYSEKGYHYAGYVPVKFGPSGKMLIIDLVFEKTE